MMENIDTASGCGFIQIPARWIFNAKTDQYICAGPLSQADDVVDMQSVYHCKQAITQRSKRRILKTAGKKT